MGVLLRALVVLALLLTLAGRTWGTETAPLRFGTTAVILQDRAEFLTKWARYLGERLGRPIQFVQRGSYAEVGELLSTSQIDIAWVCGAPYVRNRGRWQLVAVPLHQGKPLYQSYLIVPASDTRTKSYRDLEGTVFAYSDPDSNSGYLVPQFQMLEQGLRAGNLFRKTFFTWAHQDTVKAVAVGLAQAGAVDGYIWEALADIDPALIARTRIVSRSAWYGFPPIVARASLEPDLLKAVGEVLASMNADARGKELLNQMRLDGFVPGEDSLFDGIRQINQFVNKHYAQGS